MKLELRASRRLAWLLALAHAASAAVACFVLPVPWAMKLALLAALAVSAWHSVRRHALLRTPHAVDALEFKADGAAAARLAGQWHDAALEAGSFAAPPLSIVKLKLENARWARFVVIAPDMLTHEDYRRLQVWLRWGVHV